MLPSLIFLLFSTFCFAQKKITINDFSPKYHAEIIFVGGEQEEQHRIDIIETASDKTVASTKSMLSGYALENLESNVAVLPYGDHSIIIFDDFNFDGKDDIAIRTGNFGCYGGPSYDVFIFDGRTFKENEKFTDLATSYCGFFDYDPETKQIRTMTKSGCGWHEFSTFKVQKGDPVLLKRLTREVGAGPYYLMTEETWINGKRTVEESKYLVTDLMDRDRIFSFRTVSGKLMQLVDYNESLSYFFSDKEEKIELLFSGTFIYDRKNNSINFTNKDAYYSIFPDRIEVKHKGKKAVIKAENGTQKGSISEIYARFKDQGLSNLEIGES